jgi:IS30 family transposase
MVAKSVTLTPLIVGLIRRYFPKGTDFLKVSDKKLIKVEHLINSRPRKCLNYRTPYEIYAEIYESSTHHKG